MSQKYCNPDTKIVQALKELKLPLVNSEGTKIYFQKKKRYEDIFTHIANKDHHLKLKDIEIIPVIIKDSKSIRKDKKSAKAVCYYGKRRGIEKKKYLKIVCNKRSDGTQEISNIYPHKSKD